MYMYGARIGCALMAFLFILLPCEQASAQYGYGFGRNKVQYEDFDWLVLKTEHFDVYYDAAMKELAEHGAFFAEEAYADLQNHFRFSLNGRVPIIFYSSNIHFKQTNITPGFIPDGVGGFFEFLKGRVVIPANGDIQRFRRVVRHELTHVFTYARLMRVMRDHRVPPDYFLPLWFTEGLAEYWSGAPDHDHEMMMRDALFSNYLVPLENLDRIAGTYLMYKQGEAICRFISETYGEEKILQLIEHSWKDRDFRKVMEDVLRRPFLDIADSWQVWLKDQYYPTLARAEIGSRNADALAARGFNSKPTVYRHPNGQTEVLFVGNLSGYSNLYSVEVDSAYRPVGEPRVVIKGERSEQYEAFHLFESKIDVSQGGKLAFVTKSGEKDVIHVRDLQEERPVATYGFSDLVAVYSPAWSPDERALVFSGIDRRGFSDLYVYHTESGELERLTNDSYDDRDPSFSPDGERIAFASDRTSAGVEGAYNLFTYSVRDGDIAYVTLGDQYDYAPAWSPDGRQLVFTSARRDSSGRFSGQNLWVADVPSSGAPGPALASLASPGTPPLRAVEANNYRLTDLVGTAYDPVWTDDGRLIYTNFEQYRFSLRALPSVDSLLGNARQREAVRLEEVGEPWTFGSIEADENPEGVRYRRKYNLDIAQGALSQNAVWGTTGGAMIAFSDLLGDDYWYGTLYNSSTGAGDDFWRSMNVALTRVQLKQRANIAYGVYRYGGLRYDITDPDASESYPLLWETMYGGAGSVSYPVSMFRRVEVGTSLTWSDKEVTVTDKRAVDRRALLLSNSLSLVHDNTLYGMNGPMQGWRANLTAAYTTDVAYSNVSYFTLSADARHYLRLTQSVTMASWAMARMNEGREARLFILGGSWDLRGYRLFSVRGKKMWFTSHELRFPIVNAPSLYVPLLAPFGIANLRGALFVDAAHVWNDGYLDRRPLPLNKPLTTGQTLGSAGVGLRMNLFGGFVLRYDVGYRFYEGFKERSDRPFKQFFFGWDF